MTSRIFVKDLPPKINENDLIKHFESCGVITDVRLLHRDDGTLRRTAVIGFESPQSAQTAIKSSHRSYLKTSRISVNEYCPKVQKEIPSSTNANKNSSLFDSLIEDVIEDDNFKGLVEQTTAIIPSKKNQSLTKKEEKLPIWKLKVEGLPFRKCKHTFVRSLFKECKIVKVRLLHDPKTKSPKGIGVIWLASQKDVEKAMSLDKQPCGNRYLSIKMYQGSKKSSSIEDKTLQHQRFEPSSTIIIKNLWYKCTEGDLKSLVEAYGKVHSIDIPLTNENKPKGHAIITFLSVGCAIKAMNALDNTIFQGRLIRICPHKDGHLLSSSSSVCWNALFVSSNIIAERLAKRFNVQKADVYNNADLPVRLATAEADIVSKTKKFLESHGVQLSVFGSGQQLGRSNRILIAKNIDCLRLGDLKTKLSKYGTISRWIFPPEATAGIVEFVKSDGAKQVLENCSAFQPVVFEPAPIEIFSENSDHT